MSDQKIIIDTRLSIQWHPRETLQKADQVDFTNAPSIQLLDVLESQQTTTQLKAVSNKDGQSNQTELSRLESKIDLLIMLFTRNKYNRQFNKISNYEVKLSADSLYIKTSETLNLNQLVEIEMYFNPSCPEPLIFSGKVVKPENPGTLAINFSETGRLTQQFLEKYIFRLHRNEIARIKHN